MGARRFRIVAIVGGGVALIAAAAGFGPYVRYRAAEAASAYGASIEIESVQPTWGGIRIQGVDVRLEDVPSATVRLDEVRVEFRTSGRRVVLRGGTLVAVGPSESLLRELEGWRGRHPGTSTGSTGGSGSTEVEGLKVFWKSRAEAPGEALSASGVHFSRARGRTSIAAEEATVSVGGATVVVRGGRVELLRGERGLQVASLSAAAVDAEVTLPPRRLEREEASPERGRAEETKPARAKEPARAEEGDTSGRGGALREALVRAAQAIDGSMVEGANVDLGGVRARVRRGEDQLGLGPGSLTVRRDGGALVVELSPSATTPEAELGMAGSAGSGAASAPAGQQALTFRLRVPLGLVVGASQEIIADINGGPLWLSTLGVSDGDLGLFDVGNTALVSRARVVLSGDGQSASVDGEGRLQNLSLRSAALSDEPVAGLDLAWRAKATARLDGSRIDVADGEIDLGAIRLLAKGEYRRVGGAHRVRAEVQVPLTPCQAMLDSAPQGLAARVKAMRLAGSFGIEGKVRFDTARLDQEFRLDWDVSNTCRIVEAPPELSVNRFKRPFRRKAYGPDGQLVEVESGPGSPGWVPYAAISRFMEVAVMTTEDSGFHRHRGFDQEAIKNSIRENLRQLRFVRGASTVSMQLAKNLYLERTKSVARKLQEAVLTMYLEQELTKEQLMELYLNVVEFGPMVFGISAASRHYYNAEASQLSLGQALYLSSILPNPRVQHFMAGGAVSPGWTNYLRKLMETAAKRKWITEEELAEGQRETVVRGSPVPIRTAAPDAPPGAGEGASGADEHEAEGDADGWSGP